ncbi:hypothetical protein ABZ471_08070 [Streptomyces sp. NPDC005728]
MTAAGVVPSDATPRACRATARAAEVTAATSVRLANVRSPVSG